ncbi:MAG: class I SAM-dependent methyltransferase [Anaerolineae bacterium]
MEFSEDALQHVREDRLLIDQVDLWLYEEIRPYLGCRLLEIGCGMGNFASHLSDSELYVGTDISAESVSYLRGAYEDQPNVKALVADVLDDAFLDLAHYQIDTVFCLNVLEHLENDALALRNAYHVLQPGGRLVLVLPAHDWLYGTIDRAIGHYRRYDKTGVDRLLRQTGLVPVKQKYINALGAVGWFVSGRLFHHTTPPSGQLRLFNRLVPLLKTVERAMPMPFGISLMSVGEKANHGE